MFGKKGEHVKIYVISPQKIDGGLYPRLETVFKWTKRRCSCADIMSALGVAEHC